MFRILVEMLFALLYYFLYKLVLAFAADPIGSFLANAISDNSTYDKLLSNDNRKVSYEVVKIKYSRYFVFRPGNEQKVSLFQFAWLCEVRSRV